MDIFDMYYHPDGLYRIHNTLCTSTENVLLLYVIDLCDLTSTYLYHDSFMSCLHSLLEYSTEEFHALQLIVLVAFGAVD